MLLQELDEDGGCRRRCLQAARQMKEDAWCPGSRPVISSHHLQVSVRPPAAGDPGPLWAGGSPRRLLQGWPEPFRRGRGVSVTNSGWGRSGHVCHPTHERSSWRRTDLGPRHLAKVDSPPPALPFPPSLSLCLFIYLFSLFFLSFSSLASFHFTQHTNTSAHHVPRALPRFRKSAQRVAGTLGKPSLVKSCELLTPQTHSCFPLCRNLLCPHSGQAQPARHTRSTRRGNWGVLRSAAHGHGREPEPRLRARTSPRPAGLCSPQTPRRTFTGPLAHALSDSARAG